MDKKVEWKCIRCITCKRISATPLALIEHYLYTKCGPKKL